MLYNTFFCFTSRFHSDYWQYYQAPQQQTIRCDENGKSYLELGASSQTNMRCCDGRTRWCHVPCYRQRRLAVLNLSMCKLARYRQCSDPSLRRSVLICNTLRRWVLPFKFIQIAINVELNPKQLVLVQLQCG